MTEKKWRDPDILRELYHERGMSQDQIGEKLGCSGTTVGKWMDRHEVEADNPDYLQAAHSARRKNIVNLHTKNDGYERFEDTYKGDNYRFYHHRLLAVAEYGYEAVLENEVHHQNTIQWDNRPQNIELKRESLHCKMHAEERNRNNKGQFTGAD